MGEVCCSFNNQNLIDVEVAHAELESQKRGTTLGVAPEVERVGWEPEGCRFDPRLLLAECRGVPERDASP
jgi:hypothetical protein